MRRLRWSALCIVTALALTGCTVELNTPDRDAATPAASSTTPTTTDEDEPCRFCGPEETDPFEAAYDYEDQVREPQRRLEQLLKETTQLGSEPLVTEETIRQLHLEAARIQYDFEQVQVDDPQLMAAHEIYLDGVTNFKAALFLAEMSYTPVGMPKPWQVRLMEDRFEDAGRSLGRGKRLLEAQGVYWE